MPPAEIRSDCKLPITFSDRPQYVQQSVRATVSPPAHRCRPAGHGTLMDPRRPALTNGHSRLCHHRNDPNSYVDARIISSGCRDGVSSHTAWR